MAKIVSEQHKNKADYRFSSKWSPEIEQYNFTQVPNLLLGCQGHLKLKDGELLTLIHLLTFWYSHDGKVYPSINTLTKFSHKGYSTIQRRLRILEEKGFVKRRQKYRTSNNYDLVPCIIKLYEHQKKCDKLPQKRGVSVSKTRSLHSSVMSNKEYEVLKRTPFNNTENHVVNYPAVEIIG